MQNACVCGQTDHCPLSIHPDKHWFSEVLTRVSINMQTGGGNRPLSQYVIECYSAGMKVSMMPFTVPSSISSASAALKSAKMGLSLENAMA